MSHVVQVVQVPQVQVVERTIEIADRWKIVEIPEIHTVPDLCEFQHCAWPPCGTGRNCGGCRDRSKVVHGWPQGRSRMATGSFTDGHRVVHGWPQGRPRMATGSSTDGHRVIHGWPQGHPRMATGSSAGCPRSSPNGPRSSQDGPESSTDGHGCLRMARVLPFSRPRMAGEPDRKLGGGDVHLYNKMAARAASSTMLTDSPSRSSEDGPTGARTSGELSGAGTTALKAWGQCCRLPSRGAEADPWSCKLCRFRRCTVEIPRFADRGESIGTPKIQTSSWHSDL